MTHPTIFFDPQHFPRTYLSPISNPLGGSHTKFLFRLSPYGTILSPNCAGVLCRLTVFYIYMLKRATSLLSASFSLFHVRKFIIFFIFLQSFRLRDLARSSFLLFILKTICFVVGIVECRRCAITSTGTYACVCELPQNRR